MTDRRAALEAAFDSAVAEESEDTTTVAETPQEPIAAVETPTAEVVVKTEPVAKVPDSEAKAIAEVSTKRAAETPQQTPAPTGEVLKAPVTWKAAEREHWDKLPKEAQQAVLRREADVSKLFQETQSVRQWNNEFNRICQPFNHLIRAQNSTPLHAFKNLLTTAAGLATGSQEQKARIIAETIHNYGVDIATLDQILAGQPVTQAPRGVGAIDPTVAAALRPVHEFMSNIEQRKQQVEDQRRAQAEQTVSEFAESEPLFNDVADDVADLMEVAAKRGRELTLQAAFEQAVMMNPDTKAIYEQRNKAAIVSKAAGTMARARRAASSVVGAPGSGMVQPPAPKNRREALERAWDDSTS